MNTMANHQKLYKSPNLLENVIFMSHYLPALVYTNLLYTFLIFLILQKEQSGSNFQGT